MSSREPCLRDLWPSRLRDVLPPFFDRPLPVERDATCDRCAMCPPDGGEPDPHDPRYYRSDCKCCTYHPFLPNYVLGSLLEDTDARWAEGRCRVQARIVRRHAVDPLGLLQPKQFMLNYAHVYSAFGRSKALVCPYFDRTSGACSVWPSRGSVCATWFCKHIHGAQGHRFWGLLRRYLARAEHDLAAYAAHRLGLRALELLASAADRRELFVEDLEHGPPAPRREERQWGGWAGREREFFAACTRVILELGSHGYAGIGGVRQLALIRELERALEEMYDTTIPERLIRNPHLSVYPREDGRVRIMSYCTSDPLDLSGRLYRLLDHFDGGRPTDTVRTAIREDTGLRLTDGLVLTLYRHGVLRKPEPTHGVRSATSGVRGLQQDDDG